VSYDWLRKKKIQSDGEFDDERTEHRVAAGAEATPKGDAAPDTAMRNAEARAAHPGANLQGSLLSTGKSSSCARLKGWLMRKSPQWSLLAGHRDVALCFTPQETSGTTQRRL
jgi:hypothetical protein